MEVEPCRKKCVDNINVYPATDFRHPVNLFVDDRRTSYWVGHRPMGLPANDYQALRHCVIRHDEPLVPTTTYNPDDDPDIIRIGESRCIPGDVVNVSYDRAANCKHVHYIRSMKEKIFKSPPRPLNLFTSEYGRNYTPKEVDTKPEKMGRETVTITPVEADHAYRIYSNDTGYRRLMDPYASETMLAYHPHTIAAQNGYAKKDIVTLYDSMGVPHCGRGYGPKVTEAIKPLSSEPVYDRRIFGRTKARIRILPKKVNRVPHMGKISETAHRFSWPFAIPCKAVTVPGSFNHMSPWQDLCAPYMYCTEYCHINHRIPVNAVVDILRHEEDAR